MGNSMDFFEDHLVEKALSQKYAFIKVAQDGHALHLTLNRAEKKNAIHPHMQNELAFALQFAKQNKEIRAISIDAEGDVFCAGADLKAFMGMVGEFDSTVPKAKGQVLLGELFGKVHKPIVAKLTGHVFAGGFFFLTGAHYVVAQKGIRLGLPEVKRGLFPFQVMASLLTIMPRRKVVDWCVRGYNLEVEDALKNGLVTHIAAPETIDDTVETLVREISINSPTAIRMGLEALDHITVQDSRHDYLMQMLQKTIASKDGQEGMMAFKEKRTPVWTGE